MFVFTEKKPKPENIEIYTLKISSDRRCKVIKMTLADVWKQGCIIRINNFGDKEKAPHSEKDIKNQVCVCLRLFAWLTADILAPKYFYEFWKNFFRLPCDLFAAQFLHNCLQFSHIHFSLLFVRFFVLNVYRYHLVRKQSKCFGTIHNISQCGAATVIGNRTFDDGR